MTDHDDGVVVTRVEDAVREPWFVDALRGANASEGGADALLFLAHMDYRDALVDALLAAARALVGETRCRHPHSSRLGRYSSL